MLTDFHFGKILVSALSDETRIEVVRVLSGGQRYASELEQLFPVCTEVLHRHLEILSEARLISMSILDSRVYYGIHSSSINLVQNFLVNKRTLNRTRPGWR